MQDSKATWNREKKKLPSSKQPQKKKEDRFLWRGRKNRGTHGLTADSCRLKGIIERERFEEQPGALRQEGLLSTNEGIHKEG